MTDTASFSGGHPRHGQLGYLQLPAVDVAASAAFYRAVFGWVTEAGQAGFTAPGLLGQWTTGRSPSTAGGVLLWLCVDELYRTLHQVTEHGGAVRVPPYLDGGERWLAEVDDPAGTRLGLVAPVRVTQPQPLIAVRDVEASSRWYQELLGLVSDHGGPHYERLLAGGTLVLQLHRDETEHDHGRIGDPDQPAGNGMLLWFGDTADFDGAVTRATALGADVVRGPVRNPPSGQGNGPAHRELWLRDPDGYTVVIASPDGEAHEPATPPVR
ncbi:VOC family protein [Frankia sp. R82]|uniref:VOC family protein n=1 Tax=Frankia sp. R82 TaxID=2950553 RepID=UPI002043B39E|nr:VOC family protein [Frankia sp. R82]MCM3886455.1 VOC family protein [Frankia sp. R82]